MGKTRSTKPAPRFRQYRQIDMRDWLSWLDAARELAIAAGRKHQRRFTITTEALTWHALKDQMIGSRPP